jgi:predicted RNA methylase
MLFRRSMLALAVSGLALFSTGLAAPGVRVQPPGRPQSLAPFVPTPQDVVERMLELAHVTKDDVVYDLGCGDGRIPITAATKYGAHGVGVDIDPQRIAESQANAKAAGVESLVRFKLQDAMTVDVSPATVVTCMIFT